MNSLKKSIRGQLYVQSKEEYIKNISENIEVFKAVCARDFDSCLFEIFEGSYDTGDVIGIKFNITCRTFTECDASYRRFKKEIYNHFGFKVKEAFVMKTESIL